MSEIIDGNKIAQEIYQDLRVKIQDLRNQGIAPRLFVVAVGDNPVSSSYIHTKQKKAEEIGIDLEIKSFSAETTKAEILDFLRALNENPQVHGIVVQLPLPENLETQEILDGILPEKDVDCLTSVNNQKLVHAEPLIFLPPAAAAILKILDYCKVDLSSREILLVGSGDLVGKPLAALLLQRGINFRLANEFTEDIEALAKKADVLISATGQPGLIKGEMIKNQAIVIDAGTAGSEGGALQGDVDFAEAASRASLITPVPGGVGPVTVAMLLKNVIKAASPSGI